MSEKTKIHSTTLSIPVYDLKCVKVGRVTLPKEIATAKMNEDLIAQAIHVYRANQRQGTASTKSRGEVRASTRKLYRQKGTGRARAGSAGAPHRIGGGVAHGPRPGASRLSIPKRMRQRALWGALKQKALVKRMVGIDGLEKIRPKTNEVQRLLSKLIKADVVRGTVLIVAAGMERDLKRASNNLPSVAFKPVHSINTYDVLRYKTMLVMRGAVKGLAHA